MFEIGFLLSTIISLGMAGIVGPDAGKEHDPEVVLLFDAHWDCSTVTNRTVVIVKTVAAACRTIVTNTFYVHGYLLTNKEQR